MLFCREATKSTSNFRVVLYSLKSIILNWGKEFSILCGPKYAQKQSKWGYFVHENNQKSKDLFQEKFLPHS